MANIYKGSMAILDTFSPAVSLKTSMTAHAGRGFRVISIEWQEPTAAGNTAIVTDGTDPIFDETCITANQSIVKYYYGMEFPDIAIANNGVTAGSGKIVIMLEA